MLDLLARLELIARAGGGGSGGGGGGGGGSILFLVGYVPAHWWGSFIQKKAQHSLAFLLVAAGVIPYSIIWFAIGGWGIIIGLLSWFGGAAGYYGWFGKISRKMRKRAKQAVTTAAKTDPAWDAAALQQRVQAVFEQFQSDWSHFKGENMMSYLTPGYAYHMSLMLYALRLRNRQNIVMQPRIIEAFPVQVFDIGDNSQDRVTFYIHAVADDRLYETREGQEPVQLFRDTSEFHEYWQFTRVDDQWMLDNISQLTEDKLLVQSSIRQFAAQNKLCFSPDWGWLLLPSRGQIFKGGKFGVSDINNHIIGVYNKHLFELYTYNPNPRRSAKIYTVAQVALPKYYGSIVVTARSGFRLFKKTPRGYKKVSLEGVDFQKQYDVYATDLEQVTAFELLHPAYMERLMGLSFKVTIEVVDNVVYLYSTDKKADYATMYDLLQEAFKEMRM